MMENCNNMPAGMAQPGWHYQSESERVSAALQDSEMKTMWVQRVRLFEMQGAKQVKFL